MITCTQPEFQTTAGCQCANRLYEFDRMRARIAVLEAENAALREALEWAIAEIEGRTRYDRAEQFDNALATAKQNLSTGGMYPEPRAALRMIREAVEELFGPAASLESEEATLLRGPELIHEAEAIVEALRRVAESMKEGK